MEILALPVAATSWWTTTYRIEGQWIRPARLAEIKEVNPRGRYEQSSSSRTAQPPYLKLIALVQQIPWPSKEGAIPVLDRELELKVAAWVTENGLLGLLPHSTSFVVVNFRWSGRGKRSWIYMSRNVDRWTEWSEFEETFLKAGAQPPQWNGSLAFIEQEHGAPMSVHPLKEAWGRYFPDAIMDWETFQSPPLPLTEDFWESYSEPLDEFVWEMKRFAMAVADASSKDTEQRARGLAHLNKLTRSSSSIVEIDNRGHNTVRWRSPSLLGMFAIMAINDIIGAKKAMTWCPCGEPFLSANSSQRYCRPRHRERFGKAERREKDRIETARRRKAIADGAKKRAAGNKLRRERR